jgi:hypothetical protein
LPDLDDGRVQRVEVHEEDEGVVEALLRLQDEAAGVRGLPLATRFSGRSGLGIQIFVVATGGRFLFAVDLG